MVAAAELLLQHRHCHIDTLVSKNSWPLLAPSFCVHVRIMSRRDVRKSIRDTSLVPLYEERQSIFSQRTTRALPRYSMRIEFKIKSHEVFLYIVAAADLLLQHRHCHVDTVVSKTSWPLLDPRFSRRNCIAAAILATWRSSSMYYVN